MKNHNTHDSDICHIDDNTTIQHINNKSDLCIIKELYTTTTIENGTYLGNPCIMHHLYSPKIYFKYKGILSKVYDIPFLMSLLII